MSKKVKNLIEKETAKRLDGLETVAVISPRGIDGIKTNNMRRRLREKGIRMLVVKNTLAKRATSTGKIAGFNSLLDGASALVYGKDVAASTIARLLMEEKKGIEALELRGIFFDGDVYEGEEGVKKVSKMPTREEAISEILGAILGPGSSLLAALQGPGGSIGGLLSAIEEKAKEKEPAAA
jgi:ribosomal protein L10